MLSGAKHLLLHGYHLAEKQTLAQFTLSLFAALGAVRSGGAYGLRMTVW